MQVTDDLIRGVVQQVCRRCATASAAAPAATATRRSAASSTMSTAPSPPPREAQREFERARPGRPPQGRRLHPQDLQRTGRGSWAARNWKKRKIGRLVAQDRKAEGHRRPHPRRRVPAHRCVQRRKRRVAPGIRPLRRDRRHHAGDALAADAGLQRHQHAGRRQRPRLQSASRPGRASPARAFICSIKRSTKPSASTICSPSSRSRRWNRRRRSSITATCACCA